MARQKELPNTRRPDEPAAPFSHPEMDTLCEAIGKSKRKRTRANQEVVGNTKAALDKMVELKLVEYEFEYDGVKRKLRLDPKLRDVKTKVDKRSDSDSDDGDDE